MVGAPLISSNFLIETMPRISYHKFIYTCSLEREEATDLIKRYGGRVTGSISKKTV